MHTSIKMIPTDIDRERDIILLDMELLMVHFRRLMATSPTTGIYSFQKTLTQRSRSLLFLTRTRQHSTYPARKSPTAECNSYIRIVSLIGLATDCGLEEQSISI